MVSSAESRDLRSKLVNNLIRESILKRDYTKHALLNVERERYAEPATSLEECYSDVPLRIGSNQTISAPHMVAIFLDELELRQGVKVLEIGTGSGYHAAVTMTALDYLGGGELCSVEIDSELFNNARKRLEMIQTEKVALHLYLRDGYNGLPEQAPFDRIYVTASITEKPHKLYEQLANTGVMLYPFGLPGVQELIKATKEDGRISESRLMLCSFVSLRRKIYWPDDSQTV